MKIQFGCDSSFVLADLATLSEFADAFPELADSILSFVESRKQVALVENDFAAAPIAVESLVRLYPSDSFRRFMSALGARDVD